MPCSSAEFGFTCSRLDPGSGARLGWLRTPHGLVQTPAFMPVGTKAAVKGVSPEELEQVGAEMVLANTYHLWLRPGPEIIKAHGGLHRFMHWRRALLTDSGGFQVFSLAARRKISEDGVEFQSHLDGSHCFLSPELAVQVQEDLGADIIMCLDECIPYPAERSYARRSSERTVRWARRCKQAQQGRGQALFAIVQGGMYVDLRQQCALELVEMDFPGYALGGLSVGESKDEMLEVAAATLPLLPSGRPRYVMGVGTPEDLVDLVELGADMFDCVLPTRNARNGTVFTSGGRLVIKNNRHRQEDAPLEEGCGCPTCRRYSRAYLRHLFMAKELLVYRLLTLHNLYHFLELMRQIRRHIAAGSFAAFAHSFRARRQAAVDDS